MASDAPRASTCCQGAVLLPVLLPALLLAAYLIEAEYFKKNIFDTSWLDVIIKNMNKSILQNADKGTVVMSDLEESLKKGQTGVVEFANIDNFVFAEEITNDCVKNMFETMHSSPNRNTMPVTINGKSTSPLSSLCRSLSFSLSRFMYIS